VFPDNLILYSLDKKMPDYTHKGLGFIADISFGIYFLHGYVISIYFKLASRIPIINLNSRQRVYIVYINLYFVNVYMRNSCSYHKEIFR
jgi:membrane-bound acyltransferase YfiQ involved in biofilm formation